MLGWAVRTCRFVPGNMSRPPLERLPVDIWWRVRKGVRAQVNAARHRSSQPSLHLSQRSCGASRVRRCPKSPPPGSAACLRRGRIVAIEARGCSPGMSSGAGRGTPADPGLYSFCKLSNDPSGVTLLNSHYFSPTRMPQPLLQRYSLTRVAPPGGGRGQSTLSQPCTPVPT